MLPEAKTGWTFLVVKSFWISSDEQIGMFFQLKYGVLCVVMCGQLSVFFRLEQRWGNKYYVLCLRVEMAAQDDII